METQTVKHRMVRLLVWIDNHVFHHGWDWYCDWTWDLEIQDDANTGKLGLLRDNRHYHE